VEWYWQGKTEAPVKKPVPAPFFLPQISQGLAGIEMGFCGERMASDRLIHGAIRERWNSSQFYLNIQFVPRSKHIQYRLQKPVILCSKHIPYRLQKPVILYSKHIPYRLQKPVILYSKHIQYRLQKPVIPYSKHIQYRLQKPVIPYSKHIQYRLQKPVTLYREIIAVCSQIHTKHINTIVWGESIFF